MIDAILFDLNGTLLDLGALDSDFARLFGDASARERWFAELQALWMVTIVTDDYRDFPDLADAALRMRAAKEGVALATSDRAAIVEAMNELPAFPDVAPALRSLKEAGFRLAALTNGTRRSAEAQVKHAGLEGFFTKVFSVDRVRRYKPDPKPYRMAADRLDLDVDEVRLVAAHAWDIAGARAAGLATGFVARPGQAPNPLGPGPDLEASDLVDLARRIIAKDRR